MLLHYLVNFPCSTVLLDCKAIQFRSIVKRLITENFLSRDVLMGHSACTIIVIKIAEKLFKTDTTNLKY